MSARLATLNVPSTSEKRLAATLAVCAIATALVVQQFVVLPGHTRLWTELKNAGHIPLYGALSLAALWLSTALLGERRKRSFHYAVAMATTAAIGAASELLQLALPREADVVDFFRNVIGGASFLAIFSTRDAGLVSKWRALGNRAKRLTASAAVILLVAAFMPVLLWAGAYAHRAQAFPQILSFESYWSRLFLDVQHATLRIIDVPPGWHSAGSVHVGRLTLHGAEYPGLWVSEPYPDWSDYRFLRFGMYSDATEPVRLTLRIHDLLHNNEYRDRFNTSLVIRPGANTFRIPVDSIRTGPAQRELDIRNVAAIGLFAVNPPKAYTLYIDGFRLE